MTHPAIPYFLGALLVVGLPLRLRRFVQLMVPFCSLYLLIRLVPAGHGLAESVSVIHLLNREWILIRADKLAFVFAYTFVLFSFFANLFAIHTKGKLLPIAANLYVGSSIAAVFAGDMIVLFIFWELMAVSSAFLIWNRRNPSSLHSLYRYLLVHATGGLFFFAAVMTRLLAGDPLFFDLQTWDLAGKLLFVSFAINAALVPLHAWLPDAYPAGTPASSVYLSCFTTKVAVYAFARAYAGSEWLLWLGVLAAVYGVIFALMENDIRRLLSYHIICQVGYMVIGIGLGTHLAVSAGVGHAIGNILFKGLLFMATGAIIHMTWKSKLSDLGGLGPRMKAVLFFYAVGALAISGFPYLNGYVTKSLLVAASLHEHKGWLELTLLAVAVGTFLSIGLKLAWFAFFHKPAARRRLIPLPFNCHVAMAGVSVLCLLIGLFPEHFYRFLPYEVHYHVYTPDHVIQTIELLLSTLLAFIFMLKWLHTKAAITLDTDWFYRRAGVLVTKGICFPMRYGQESIQAGWTRLIKTMSQGIEIRSPKKVFASVGFPLLCMAAGFLVTGILIMLFAA